MCIDPRRAPRSDDVFGGGADTTGGGGGATAAGGGGGLGTAAVLVVVGICEADACFVRWDLLDRFGAGAVDFGGGRSVLISVVG